LLEEINEYLQEESYMKKLRIIYAAAGLLLVVTGSVTAVPIDYYI